MTLVDLAVQVHRQLDAADLAHAFGGALALAYVAEPRGTVDIDVNVFAMFDDVDVAVSALGAVGLRAERPRTEWMPMAGIRLRQESGLHPVDVFPSLDERYAEIERRCVRHPFGPNGVELPFLSAEDLVLFKLSFGRDKDWVDVRAVAESVDDLDMDYIEYQLIGLRGPAMHPRIARLRGMRR
ncbi:MAG TPA: DUF6036 family nucleotidyltransferase [Acidimicrobiales bacterium]|nr:DUF6036 family nucleotidyltransferase [Acidimicrobiales bacterium]